MTYEEANNSYSDKLVFRFGDEAGFYSEYNNMLLVAHFCLIDHINFNISSVGNNFHPDGWTHFFEPFCREYPEGINRTQNKRKVFDARNQEVRDYMADRGIRYFTYHVFKKYRAMRQSDQMFSIPELGLHGRLKDNLRALNKAVYRFNDFSKKNIEKIVRSVGLPQKYVGIHIRRGDKIKENPHTRIETYMDALKKQGTSITDLFIYTDDVSVLAQLKEKYPEYTYYSVDNAITGGFDHHAFVHFDQEKKDQCLFEMFANIEILANAELTIGTYATNPGTFLGFYHKKDAFVGIDSDTYLFR